MVNVRCCILFLLSRNRKMRHQWWVSIPGFSSEILFAASSQKKGSIWHPRNPRGNWKHEMSHDTVVHKTQKRRCTRGWKGVKRHRCSTGGQATSQLSDSNTNVRKRSDDHATLKKSATYSGKKFVPLMSLSKVLNQARTVQEYLQKNSRVGKRWGPGCIFIDRPMFFCLELIKRVVDQFNCSKTFRFMQLNGWKIPWMVLVRKLLVGVPGAGSPAQCDNHGVFPC